MKFESGNDLVEVTSLHRPDTSWSKVDASGHLHCWYVNGEPAKYYDPANKQHELPTLHQVQDPPLITEEGEPVSQWHLECNQCNERIEPGYTADIFKQYVPGLTWYRIDGDYVTEAEYMRALGRK